MKNNSKGVFKGVIMFKNKSNKILFIIAVSMISVSTVTGYVMAKTSASPLKEEEQVKISSNCEVTHVYNYTTCGESEQSLFFCSFIIFRSCRVQKDDVASLEAVPPIKSSIPFSVQLRSKIGNRLVPLIPQAASYDLFHLSIMDVNTWSEFHLLPFLFKGVRPLCRGV